VKFEEVNNEKERHIDEYDELKDMIKYDQGNTLTTDAFGGAERRSLHVKAIQSQQDES